MENAKPNKFKVPPASMARMQSDEEDLVEMIQAGLGTQAMRDRLAILQEILPHVEADPTWSDQPTPPEAA